MRGLVKGPVRGTLTWTEPEHEINISRLRDCSAHLSHPHWQFTVVGTNTHGGCSTWTEYVPGTFTGKLACFFYLLLANSAWSISCQHVRM